MGLGDQVGTIGATTPAPVCCTPEKTVNGDPVVRVVDVEELPSRREGLAQRTKENPQRSRPKQLDQLTSKDMVVSKVEGPFPLEDSMDPAQGLQDHSRGSEKSSQHRAGVVERLGICITGPAGRGRGAASSWSGPFFRAVIEEWEPLVITLSAP